MGQLDLESDETQVYRTPTGSRSKHFTLPVISDVLELDSLLNAANLLMS